jgi:hypothetical protein
MTRCLSRNGTRAAQTPAHHGRMASHPLASRLGLADIVDRIGRWEHAARTGHAPALKDGAVTMEGNAILSRVLGSAERSRALAGRASRAQACTGRPV